MTLERRQFVTQSGSRVFRVLEENLIFVSLLAIVAFFGLISDSFLSLTTLATLFNQLPALTVVSIGMTLVLISGGIDLSVGSVVALSAGVIGAGISLFGLPLPLAACLGILAGALAGLANGGLGAYLRLPIFIVTLGMLEVARGLAYLVTDSQTVYIGAKIQAFAIPWGGSGVSASILVALTLVVAFEFVLRSTVFGRQIVAVGSNESAAEVSGIDPRRVRCTVLVISGLLAGLGGLMNAAYLGSADPNAGIGLELSAIAAAVIGGTSLMGGRGSVIGAFVGVLIVSVLQIGLAQIGITEPTKRVITGAVIILAVILDRWRA
ncbi:MAG: ABC transporter permease [Gammaproteobacteria bacterium]|nr:ABC transporter permease [Gammaproteobacteria bacterium]